MQPERLNFAEELGNLMKMAGQNIGADSAYGDLMLLLSYLLSYVLCVVKTFPQAEETKYDVEYVELAEKIRQLIFGLKI